MSGDAARRDRAEQAEQRRAGHVGADRLRRLPGDRGQADERLRADQPALDRGEDLLLAPRAREVVLGRVALVLAGPREGERLLAVEVVLAALEAQRVAAVLGAAVDAADHAAAGVVDPAERVDEGGEVLEVHLDEVVDRDAEVLRDRLGGEPRAAVGVGGVDLVAAVAGDVDDRVARDREAGGLPAAGAHEHDRVRRGSAGRSCSRRAPSCPWCARRSRARGSCSAR